MFDSNNRKKIMKKIAGKLKIKRKQLLKSQDEIAEAANLSQKVYWKTRIWQNPALHDYLL